MKTTISRKQALLQAASQYHRKEIYVPDTKRYVAGLLQRPDKLTKYQSGLEPVVDASEAYHLPDAAWLTVNGYNALILNTKNMLIADIDFGDDRLNQFATVGDVPDVTNNLKELHLLDKDLYPYKADEDDIMFADQSYRLYRTHSGCRVICTSIPVPWPEMGWHAERFLRFLRSDPEYIKLCATQQCYRARLTPKPWRQTGEGNCVCIHIGKAGTKPLVAPELEEQLRLHDELTLPQGDWEELA